MTTTARDIVEGALRKIHVLGRGQSLPADLADDALEALNALLGSLSAEVGYIYTQARETFPLTSSASYTIGSGGVFNTALPAQIQSAFVTNGTTDTPLQCYDVLRYNELADKTITGEPTTLYYDGGYPLGTIRLYPVPNASYTLTISSRKYLSEFTDLNTVYDMPPEYKRMLIANLGVEMAPEYEKEPSLTLQRIANESKRIVMSKNQRNQKYLSDARMDTTRAGYNIYTGTYQ